MRYGFVTSPRRVHELGSSYYEPNDFLQSRNIANCSYFASFDVFSFVEFVSKVEDDKMADHVTTRSSSVRYFQR